MKANSRILGWHNIGSNKGAWLDVTSRRSCRQYWYTTGGRPDFSAIAARSMWFRSNSKFKWPETSSRNIAMWQKQGSSRILRDGTILETCRSFRPKIPARWSDSGNLRKFQAEDSSMAGNFRKFQAEDSSMMGRFWKLPQDSGIR